MTEVAFAMVFRIDFFFFFYLLQYGRFSPFSCGVCSASVQVCVWGISDDVIVI